MKISLIKPTHAVHARGFTIPPSIGLHEYRERYPRMASIPTLTQLGLIGPLLERRQQRSARREKRRAIQQLFARCQILTLNRENASGPRRVDESGSGASRSDKMSDATVILAAIEAGDSKAPEQLLVLVYDELRRLAASKIAQEAPGQTLQPTALVHEAWLRLVGDQNPSFKDREHFFRASAEGMRRILIDRARRKHTKRHGGGYQRIDFEGFDLAAPAADDQLLAVNEALDKLAIEHPVQADLVKLRYFAGMTNEEVSQVLGISLSTVKNYWTFSRAWLLNEIEGQ
jgi:RNA polymerase sigma factor (TIGR02999 family)